jgi:hypothetical protein
MRRIHRAALLAVVLTTAAVFTAKPVVGQNAIAMSTDARAYLTAALDTIEAVTLGRDTVPWRLIRDSAFHYAYGARKPADTYGAIEWALRRANKHSFLQARQPGAVSQVIDERYGYIRVPQRGGAAVALADSLHTAVRVLEAEGVCGWVVDLRGNGGGNMWPMLAGIGPLLGDSVNRGSRLSDGANMVVTTGYYADRHRAAIDERLEPDESVSGGVEGWPFPTDRVADAAMQWLAKRPACDERR